MDKQVIIYYSFALSTWLVEPEIIEGKEKIAKAIKRLNRLGSVAKSITLRDIAIFDISSIPTAAEYAEIACLSEYAL